jgi:hypothetical protein
MSFSGERIAPTAAIAAILNSYPFSAGLFRELLQNSDDAGASQQVRTVYLSTFSAEELPRFLFLIIEIIP